jgi:transposase-like protein
MPQHFLLSKAARSLSLAQVARMSDEEARATFAAIRWTANNGEPFCPKCGCLAVYSYAARPIFKCKACNAQFSVTSGTIFASRKLPVRDYLLAIAIFCNGAKGHSALQLSRDLNVQYKTAFVMAHKIREAMGSDVHDEEISGEVEVDGAYLGGYSKPANRKENRRDRRRSENKTGKRQVVVVIRERNGTTLPFVVKSEADGVNIVRNRVSRDTVVHADEASHWDALHAGFETHRINHSEAYSTEESNTNLAESFFSRLRRAEIGTHHHIAGPYLAAYANEMAWREDHRRIANGEQFQMVAWLAMGHPVSRVWKGYWQRRAT